MCSIFTFMVGLWVALRSWGLFFLEGILKNFSLTPLKKEKRKRKKKAGMKGQGGDPAS